MLTGEIRPLVLSESLGQQRQAQTLKSLPFSSFYSIPLYNEKTDDEWCHIRVRTFANPGSHHTIVCIWRKNLHRDQVKKWALWARPRFETTNVLPYNKLDLETDTTNHWQGPENPGTRNIWGCGAPARGLNRFSLPALQEREGGSVSTSPVGF